MKNLKKFKSYLFKKVIEIYRSINEYKIAMFFLTSYCVILVCLDVGKLMSASYVTWDLPFLIFLLIIIPYDLGYRSRALDSKKRIKNVMEWYKSRIKRIDDLEKEIDKLQEKLYLISRISELRDNFHKNIETCQTCSIWGTKDCICYIADKKCDKWKW